MNQSMKEAFGRCQNAVERTGKRWEVYEHVGDYGRPGGDVLPTHEFAIRPAERPLPDDVWALIAVCDPAPRMEEKP